MEVVEEFLRLRREGRGDDAIQLLAPNAAVASPWGGMRYGSSVTEYLKDESTFVKKGFLDNVPIQKIDENTFQREFTWDRGMFEYGNFGFISHLPKWREMYFVKDGQIRLVTANKQPREKNIFKVLLGQE
ncbi:Hypothetical protein, putative [Bodo saltans]|uniref:Uncharacterized protein n=1 Tax=Bodo saltans TaxID=75058 RepID=A0A0S4J1U2_BODSA|nr:Hypothetical protein, putative [Bodo saltans]|eukprot:CUG59000.1 Hypothetical protein, putative [Bodo saltans]